MSRKRTRSAPKGRGKTKDKESEKLYADWRRFELNIPHVYRAGRQGFGLNRKTGRPFSAAHDVLGVADVLSQDCTEVEYAQVKASPDGFVEARKKMERVCWHPGVRVVVACHEVVPDPGNKSNTWHFWRREELLRSYEYAPCDKCAATGTLPTEEGLFECPWCGGRKCVAKRVASSTWHKHEAVRFNKASVEELAIQDFRRKRAEKAAAKAAKEKRRAEREAAGKVKKRRANVATPDFPWDPH